MYQFPLVENYLRKQVQYDNSIYYDQYMYNLLFHKLQYQYLYFSYQDKLIGDLHLLFYMKLVYLFEDYDIAYNLDFVLILLGSLDIYLFFSLI